MKNPVLLIKIAGYFRKYRKTRFFEFDRNRSFFQENQVFLTKSERPGFSPEKPSFSDKLIKLVRKTMLFSQKSETLVTNLEIPGFSFSAERPGFSDFVSFSDSEILGFSDSDWVQTEFRNTGFSGSEKPGISEFRNTGVFWFRRTRFFF